MNELEKAREEVEELLSSKIKYFHQFQGRENKGRRAERLYESRPTRVTKSRACRHHVNFHYSVGIALTPKVRPWLCFSGAAHTRPNLDTHYDER